MNKYHRIRKYSELAQGWFDSTLECRRAEELILSEMADEIEDLRFQIKFRLCDKPKIDITLDFSYLEGGKRKFEDTKGIMTRDFRTKLAWLKEKYNVDVKITKKDEVS